MQKVLGFPACWHDCNDSFMNFLFSFYSGLHIRFIYLETWATAAINLNLWYTSSNSPFSCNVVTFLCFSGVLQHHYWHFIWIPWFYSRYCTKHDEKYVRATKYHFLCNLLHRWTAHLEMVSVTWHFKLIVPAQHSSNRRWLRNDSRSTVCTVVNFMRLWFRTDLYIHVHFFTINGMVCKC